MFSYRTLDKRALAALVLHSLEYPDMAEQNLKEGCYNSDKRKNQMEAALRIAAELKQDTRANKRVNLSQYSPYLNQIRALIS